MKKRNGRVRKDRQRKGREGCRNPEKASRHGERADL